MKITVAGRSFTLTSALKVEEIVTLKKYKPEALDLVDEDKNTVFSVNYQQGKDSMTSFAMQYGSEATVEAGHALYTGSIPAHIAGAAVKDYVADEVGKIKEKLEAVEAQAKAAVAEVNARQAKIVASIEVVS